MRTVDIRLATHDDLSVINSIYNHYVACSTCTYQEEPETIERRQRWFAAHGPMHPVTVAVLEGRVVGWTSLSPYHARSAYRFTVENSLYVDHERHRQGIGSALLADCIERARSLGHHAIISGIDAEQTASIALHAKFDFEPVGRLKQVGFKFGRWLDVVEMQLMI